MFVSMAALKRKGDLAELKIATHLVSCGHRILLPFGEDHNYDLVVDDGERMLRVQVKHTTSDGKVIEAKCFTHSLTNGRVRSVKRYTAAMIDWLAIWDATTDRCFYIPATLLGEGRSHLRLRYTPTLNNQRARVRWAEDFTTLTTTPTAAPGLDFEAAGP
ncbi:MAG: hypothetical protein JWP18_1498 [Solirubrobacterales bacterium]|nr:hypothetical protein [Solirubrobacterales bacterium]